MGWFLRWWPVTWVLVIVIEEARCSVGAPERVISIWELLEHQHTPKTRWLISNALALELAEHLERTRPERILEIGSGFSTVILAAYAARYEDVRVVSLEHSNAWIHQPMEWDSSSVTAHSLSQEPSLIRARSLPNGPSGQRGSPRERGASAIGRLTRVTKRVRSNKSRAVQLSRGVFLESETSRRRRR